jgi:hypothetical protein
MNLRQQSNPWPDPPEPESEDPGEMAEKQCFFVK